MPDFSGTAFGELAHQFPLVGVTLLVSWYYMRVLVRQQARELEAKTQEIERILCEKKLEIDRLLEERKKYFQLFLKELRAANQADDRGPQPPPEPRK